MAKIALKSDKFIILKKKTEKKQQKMASYQKMQEKKPTLELNFT